MRTGPGRGSAPRCPFCGADLDRPKEMVISAMEKAHGGTCSCGAVFLADPTGKNVGTVMVQALGLAADALGKPVTELVPDQDYEDAILNYDWRTHRSSGVSAGYMDGYGRLYVVKVKRQAG